MTGTALLFVASLAWLFSVATTHRNVAHFEKETEERNELTYVYHARTMVIGQKDFDISARVSTLGVTLQLLDAQNKELACKNTF